MDKNSNRYILIYATVVALIAATVLAVIAQALKPRQERNAAIEQKQMILRAAGIASTTDNAETLYDQEIATDTLYDETVVYRHGAQLIVPLHGTGLWGPIWGYMAFDTSWTVTGAVFDHKGETPGLGGEIASEAFAQRFIGKRIVDEEEQFNPIVLKKHADAQSPYEVDAISGGTMTSNGVTKMLKDELENIVAQEQKRKERCHEQ